MQAEEELPEFPNLNTLMDEQIPKAPQPEAVIDSADCKLNLLDHIAHSQSLVEERLDNFEAQIDALDGGGIESDSEEDLVRTKQTMQMLLQDLATLKELSQGSYL